MSAVDTDLGLFRTRWAIMEAGALTAVDIAGVPDLAETLTASAEETDIVGFTDCQLVAGVAQAAAVIRYTPEWAADVVLGLLEGVCDAEVPEPLWALARALSDIPEKVAIIVDGRMAQECLRTVPTDDEIARAVRWAHGGLLDWAISGEMPLAWV